MDKILKSLQLDKHFVIAKDTEISSEIIPIILCMDGLGFYHNGNEVVELTYPKMSELSFDDMTRIRVHKRLHISDKLSYADVMSFLGKVKYTPPNA
jgi:predicted metallopeptidase